MHRGGVRGMVALNTRECFLTSASSGGRRLRAKVNKIVAAVEHAEATDEAHGRHLLGCAHTHARTRARTHTHTHARLLTRTHARLLTRTHARAHARPHARTHARTRALAPTRTPA
eukprot:6204278-Pleurochrysis_carterae.AAC.1